MNDPAPAPPVPARPARGGRGLSWLLLVLLVALAAWQGRQWWQAQVRADAEQAGQLERLAGLEARVDALRRDQRANAERVQQAAATNRLLREELLGLGQRAALLEDSIADLAAAGAGGIQALRLDEADLLLATAGQRLQAGDLDGARQSYAIAATVLGRLDGPEAIDLRQALAQEREALDALGPDPRVAAGEQLDALERALATLPGRNARKAEEAAPWWRRLASRVVDVRPSDGATIVAPSARAAGLAALQVELSLARAALERRDAAAFDAALGRIDGWLVRLWPPSPQLGRVRQAVRALGAAPIRVEAPELGSTLVQLRRLQESGT